MSSLYHDELIEHYKSSPYRKAIPSPTIAHGDINVSCGDKIDIMISAQNNHITDIGFQGSGCVISQAATSMLCEKIENMDLDEVLELDDKDILTLINIELGPVRMKCATLGLLIIKDGIQIWKKTLSTDSQP